ncbi:hypothetical protein MY11210_001324 [Beauveria gryllotalpidicola]
MQYPGMSTIPSQGDSHQGRLEFLLIPAADAWVQL